MENKIALRCVQNGDIKLTDAFVPDADRIPGVGRLPCSSRLRPAGMLLWSNHLPPRPPACPGPCPALPAAPTLLPSPTPLAAPPGVSSFSDTNKVLAISRIMVAWQPVGLALGAYDMCARYLQQRRQFGAPLASFQLMQVSPAAAASHPCARSRHGRGPWPRRDSAAPPAARRRPTGLCLPAAPGPTAVQEKLQRMLSTCQAMWLMAWRLTKLYEAGKLTHEQASLVKAWTTLRGREVSRPAQPAGRRRRQQQQGAAPLAPAAGPGALALLPRPACARPAAHRPLLAPARLTTNRLPRRWLPWGASCWAATASCLSSWWPRPSATQRRTTGGRG